MSACHIRVMCNGQEESESEWEDGVHLSVLSHLLGREIFPFPSFSCSDMVILVDLTGFLRFRSTDTRGLGGVDETRGHGCL